MALTQEQQDQLDFQKAQNEISKLNQLPNLKMEAIRIARDILVESDRNKPVNERSILAEDVTKFADTIIQYVNN